VAHKTRIVVDAVDANVVDEIYGVVRIELGDDRVEQDANGLIYCFVDPPQRAKRVRHDIMRALAGAELADAVVDPMRVEHWNEETEVWVPNRADAEAAAASVWRVRRRLTDVRWVVTVEPAGVFQWTNVREQVTRRGRPILEERPGDLDVPAIDEDDASQLAADLEQLTCVRSVKTRPLGWLERWRRREQVFGNYASNSGSGIT
jgi:hypothetical protein